MDDMAARPDGGASRQQAGIAREYAAALPQTATTAVAAAKVAEAAGGLITERLIDPAGGYGNGSTVGAAVAAAALGGYFGDSTGAHYSRYQFVQRAGLHDASATVMSSPIPPLPSLALPSAGASVGSTPLVVYTSVAPEFLAQMRPGDNLSDVLAYSFPAMTMDWRVEYYAHYFAMPLLLFCGLIFQCLNILTLNRLLAAGYIYLKASAIADVLSIFALVPFVLRHGGVHNPYNYQEMFYHAHIELPLINALIALSTLCLVMMTIDRFLSIYFAIKCFTCCGSHARTRIYLCVAALCVLVTLLFVPSAWQRALVPFVERDVAPPYERRVFWRIGRNWQIRHAWLFSEYIFLREFVTRILPMVLITILNVFISYKLRRMASRRTSQCTLRTELTRERDHNRTRLGWLLVITAVIFVACNLPACLLSFFVHYFGYNSLAMQVFRAIANCIQVSHYLHYFYLYALYSSEYRRALKSVFMDVICCSNAALKKYCNVSCCQDGVKRSPPAVGRGLGDGGRLGDGGVGGLAAGGIEDVYDGTRRRSTLHTALPTSTVTENAAARSRLSSILLGQIRQYGSGFPRCSRKQKTSAAGSLANIATKDAANGYFAVGSRKSASTPTAPGHANGLLSRYVTAKLSGSALAVCRKSPPNCGTGENGDEAARILATSSPLLSDAAERVRLNTNDTLK